MPVKLQCCVPHWNVHVCGYAQISRWDIGHINVPSWRLYWANQPGAWITHRGVRWELGPDRFIMIAPCTRLESGMKSASRHLWVHFTAGSPYDFLHDWIGKQPLTPTTRVEVQSLAGQIGHSIETSPRFGTRLASILSHGMSVLSDEQLSVGRLESRIDGALRLMRGNLAMSVGELAAAVHLSPRSLNRLFAGALGRSPKQLQSLLRQNQAELSLMYSNDTIEMIAEQCGYCDRYHFSRVFGRAHGMGPATYRDSARHAS